MKYPENFIQGNHSAGRTIKPLGVVWHHNYLSVEDLMKQMTEKKPVSLIHGALIPASYHVVIWKDGSRTRFAEDRQRAWHAGNSMFKGMPHCNNFMLGPCFHGNTNAEPLTQEQIGSAIEWFIPRKEEFNLQKDWLPDHRQVAPKRKVDLNPIEYNRLMKAINYLYL